mgnify:CR=1 FL=1
MQINHSENWEQDLINHGVAIVDLRKPSGSIIYCGEKSITAGFTKHKHNSIFEFISNDSKSNIRLFCLLVQTDNEHYRLYFKFEKDNYVTKEINRINVFCYDLLTYIEMDMFEFEVNFEEKYNELYDICLKIKNNA